ncbi:MAG TPA: flagellar export chaperone FliS [Jatrophihabitans sp.]|jgi:flagellar protein FliS|nr:flagellar export chaperone FliS [Jatrophihabitans sp.]
MSDDLRARFLRDRVLTATPAQRVVMLYDRLALDIARAGAGAAKTADIDHAVQIVVELRSSLDVTAGGPADNLASIYAHLIIELLAIRGGERDRLPKVAAIVESLRQAWTQAAEQVLAPPQPGAQVG